MTGAAQRWLAPLRPQVLRRSGVRPSRDDHPGTGHLKNGGVALSVSRRRPYRSGRQGLPARARDRWAECRGPPRADRDRQITQKINRLIKKERLCFPEIGLEGAWEAPFPQTHTNECLPRCAAARKMRLTFKEACILMAAQCAQFAFCGSAERTSERSSRCT
jgi:hypothetical protein